jgi:hypothetical protein
MPDAEHAMTIWNWLPSKIIPAAHGDVRVFGAALQHFRNIRHILSHHVDAEWKMEDLS